MKKFFMSGAIVLGACVFALSLVLGISPVQDVKAGGIARSADPALFTLDGVNPEMGNDLMDLVNSLNKHRVYHNGQLTHYMSNIQDILDANNGDLFYFYMFEEVVNRYNAIDPGYEQASVVENFTRQQWTLVYVAWPVDAQGNLDGDPVMTFWMNGAYRTAPGAATWWTSATRPVINQDFVAVLDNFDGVAEMVLTPAQLPGDWQQTQPNSPHTLGQTLARIEVNNMITPSTNDLLWIPSLFELFPRNQASLFVPDRDVPGNPLHWDIPAVNPQGFATWEEWVDDWFDRLEDDISSFGIWGFTENAHRAPDMTRGGVSDNSWIRTRRASVGDHTGRIVNANGQTANSGFVDQGMRPAFHLCGQALREAMGINASITSASSQHARMTIDGQQVTQANFLVDRQTGEKTITIDAGALNRVTNITVSRDGESLILDHEDTAVAWNPFAEPEPLATFTTWYDDPATGRVVFLTIYGPTNTFNISVTTTNNWNVTRIHEWPFGTSPDDETLLFTGNYTSVIGAPATAPGGHHFVGWFTDPVAGTQVTGATVASNLGNHGTVDRITTIYARWSMNTATINRVHYNANVEVMVATRLFSAVLSEPEGTDRPLGMVFAGWFRTPSGGSRLTVNDFISVDEHGQTFNIYARWQVYVSTPTNGVIDFSQNRITWAQPLADHFLVSVNGAAPVLRTESYFSFANFTPGTYQFSIIAFNATNDPSIPFTITLVIPAPATYSILLTSEGSAFYIIDNLVNLANAQALINAVVPPANTTTQTFGGWRIVGINNRVMTVEAIWNPVTVSAPVVIDVNFDTSTLTFNPITGATFEVRVGTTGTFNTLAGNTFDFDSLTHGEHRIYIRAFNADDIESPTTVFILVIPDTTLTDLFTFLAPDADIEFYESNTTGTHPAAPVRTGYVFLRWDLVSVAPVDTDLVHTFHAVWAPLTVETPSVIDVNFGTGIMTFATITGATFEVRVGTTGTFNTLAGNTFDFDSLTHGEHRIYIRATVNSVVSDVKLLILTIPDTTLTDYFVFSAPNADNPFSIENTTGTRPAGPVRTGYTFVRWELVTVNIVGSHLVHRFEAKWTPIKIEAPAVIDVNMNDGILTWGAISGASRFETRIGTSGTWTTATGNTLDFSELPEGTHRIYIRAFNADGIESPTTLFILVVSDEAKPSGNGEEPNFLLDNLPFILAGGALVIASIFFLLGMFLMKKRKV